MLPDIKIHPPAKPFVYLGAAVVALAAASLLTRSEAAKIVGITVLTGAAYGITNDMFACRDCPEYFTIGQKHWGPRLVESLDPNLNAVVWGVFATWHVCTVAGIVLAFAARKDISRLNLKSKISAAQIAPYLAGGAIFALFMSHGASRGAQKFVKSHWDSQSVRLLRKDLGRYANVPYYDKRLQCGWVACDARNMAAYIALVIGGVFLAIAMIRARQGKSQWPKSS